MHVILVNFTIRQESVAPFRKAMLANAHASLTQEKGCQAFDVCWDPADDTQVLLYEVYDDADAFTAHRESTHFLEFQKTVAPWIADKSLSSWEKAYPKT